MNQEECGIKRYFLEEAEPERQSHRAGEGSLREGLEASGWAGGKGGSHGEEPSQA